MDQELIAYLDKRFNEVLDRVDARFGGVDARLDGVETRLDGVDARFVQVEGTIRGLGIEIEGLRGQIQQVAEGVAAGNENLAAFRTEVYEKFEEMRQMFNTSHSNLHRRVSALEDRQERRRT